MPRMSGYKNWYLRACEGVTVEERVAKERKTFLCMSLNSANALVSQLLALESTDYPPENLSHNMNNAFIWDEMMPEVALEELYDEILVEDIAFSEMCDECIRAFEHLQDWAAAVWKKEIVLVQR